MPASHVSAGGAAAVGCPSVPCSSAACPLDQGRATLGWGELRPCLPMYVEPFAECDSPCLGRRMAAHQRVTYHGLAVWWQVSTLGDSGARGDMAWALGGCWSGGTQDGALAFGGSAHSDGASANRGRVRWVMCQIPCGADLEPGPSRTCIPQCPSLKGGERTRVYRSIHSPRTCCVF